VEQVNVSGNGKDVNIFLRRGFAKTEPWAKSGNSSRDSRIEYRATGDEEIGEEGGSFCIAESITYGIRRRYRPAESNGVAAELAVKLSAVPLIVGGASLLLGVKPKLGGWRFWDFLQEFLRLCMISGASWQRRQE